MKRKTAKEILAESFRELAGKKKADKITVGDIAGNCGYSTTTFYRHFRDKYDLIVWDHTQYVAEIMEKIGKNGYSWNNTLLEGMRYYQENKEYLANLLRYTSGHDSFVRYMTEINCSALTKFILKNISADRLDEETEMYVRIYCSGTTMLNCEWILGRYSVTPEELALIHEKALPEPLRKYLY
ncbi:MAG: TetR/AcrR family transcriptional regulator C-terminal domain-containing protein [Ruminococcus sp.]|nr:TetR/AcrR family transcriptional regulator C-terminal domain-containing protein [Ruminococcus sp.]MDO4882957.1 TetR/AcrR family transcriptional regulator C-terminal domain-containing protein [Oscillospiraceae bacterium]